MAFLGGLGGVGGLGYPGVGVGSCAHSCAFLGMSTAVILVLFILLVIISRVFFI